MNNVIKFLDAFLHEIGRVGNSINELGIDLSREGKVFHGKFVDHRVDFYNRCVNSMGVKGERGGAYSQSAVFIIMCQLMVLEMRKEESRGGDIHNQSLRLIIRNWIRHLNKSNGFQHNENPVNWFCAVTLRRSSQPFSPE